MPDSPTLLTVAAQPAAIIRITIPRPEMPSVMGPAIRELHQVLRAQGIPPAGPLFAHHLRMRDGIFDFELGLPTDRPIAPAGRAEPGQLPAATVARTVHCGDYAGLPAAWGAFRAWIAANGHQPMADLWEVYAVGPEAGPDAAAWRTELYQPLRTTPAAG